MKLSLYADDMILYAVAVVLQLQNHVGLFATPWTIAHQAPLSLGFSRQDYWDGCHALIQGIFPTQGSNQVSHAVGGFVTF